MLSLLALTGCVDAQANDGSEGKERLSQGYSKSEEKNPFGGDTSSSQKFWKGYAPFVGVQFWGMGEGETWGGLPSIDFDSGTLKNTSNTKNKTCMPVFGAYGEGGASIDGEYDVSSIKRFEFDAWGEGADEMELEVSVYHADANTEKSAITPERQHFTMDLTPQDTTHILFLLGWSGDPEDYLLHIENIAFYDGEGNQVTHIPFVIPEEAD